MLGRHLRKGRFPALVPWEWMSGNYSLEEAGIYNPPQLLVDLIAPSVDNLALYVTVVKLVFSIIAALGVFRVCRAYTARAPWAAMAGVAFPLSGWFLFFDESSWATSLTGTAWMLHSWASSVRYVRGRGGPIPVFVFLYLAISVQYVFPTVESAIMTITVAVGEVVHQRMWRPSLRLLLVAACAGLAGLETYLPGILQLADRALVPPADQGYERAWDSLTFGNYAKNMRLDYVNAYTPIGYATFSAMLCMGWDGSTCPDAYRRAFSVEPSTRRTVVDLMKVDRLVLQRAQYPDARNQPAPPGWQWVDYPGHERYIWILERTDGPISVRNGLIADANNVAATSISKDSVTSRIQVSSAVGGRIVLARLAWPGYRVTLDGHDIPFATVAKTFLAVDIPAGTRNGELVVTWRPPGWKIGIATALAGLIGLGLLQRWYRRGRRTEPDPPNDTPPQEHPDHEPQPLVATLA